MGAKGGERFQGRFANSPPTEGHRAGCGVLLLPAVRGKYLKARLVETGASFPRTHDLLQLLNLCAQAQPLWLAYAKVVDEMTDYAVDFRYPGQSATLREAKTALKHCRSLRAEVRRSFGLKA
jgi:hypothetical protein